MFRLFLISSIVLVWLSDSVQAQGNPVNFSAHNGYRRGHCRPIPPHPHHKKEKGPLYAISMMFSAKNHIVGIVHFSQKSRNKPVHVYGKIFGLSPGKHGLHIHQYGDMRRGCHSMGNIFNPYNQKHGGPKDRKRRVGGLRNIFSTRYYVAGFNFWDYHISLFQGRDNIYGRGLVVTQRGDDYGKGGKPESLKNGNSGSRLACGIIAVSGKP